MIIKYIKVPRNSGRDICKQAHDKVITDRGHTTINYFGASMLNHRNFIFIINFDFFSLQYVLVLGNLEIIILLLCLHNAYHCCHTSVFLNHLCKTFYLQFTFGKVVEVLYCFTVEHEL